MPEVLHHVEPADRERLVACLREVTLAREALTDARRRPDRAWDKQVLREDLLASLEGYASAITVIGVPVPRKLRTEIVLYQSLRNRA